MGLLWIEGAQEAAPPHPRKGLGASRNFRGVESLGGLDLHEWGSRQEIWYGKLAPQNPPPDL